MAKLAIINNGQNDYDTLHVAELLGHTYPSNNDVISECHSHCTPSSHSLLGMAAVSGFVASQVLRCLRRRTLELLQNVQQWKVGGCSGRVAPLRIDMRLRALLKLLTLIQRREKVALCPKRRPTGFVKFTECPMSPPPIPPEPKPLLQEVVTVVFEKERERYLEEARKIMGNTSTSLLDALADVLNVIFEPHTLIAFVSFFIFKSNVSDEKLHSFLTDIVDDVLKTKLQKASLDTSFLLRAFARGVELLLCVFLRLKDIQRFPDCNDTLEEDIILVERVYNAATVAIDKTTPKIYPNSFIIRFRCQIRRC